MYLRIYIFSFTLIGVRRCCHNGCHYCRPSAAKIQRTKETISGTYQWLCRHWKNTPKDQVASSNLASSFQSPMTANRITSLNVLLSRKKNDIISSKIAMIFSTRSSIWDNTLFMEGSLCGTIKRLL